MLSELAKIVRRSGICGSDIAGILGCAAEGSGYRTAFEVFQEKKFGFEREISDDLKAIFANGHAKEPLIAALYGEWLHKQLTDADPNAGICVHIYHSSDEESQTIIGEENQTIYIDKHNKSAIYRHPTYPFLLASPDRIICKTDDDKGWGDEWWGLEIKTANWFDRPHWGMPGTDKILDHYYLQIQHYMLVTGLKRWDLAVLIGDLVKDGIQELRVYSFKYDEEIGRLIIEGAKNFQENHLDKGIAPLPNYGHSSTLKVFKQIYKKFDEKLIDLPDECILFADQRKEALQKILQYDDVKVECTNHILYAMGDATLGSLSDGRAFKRTLTKNGRVILTLIGGGNE